MVTPKATCLNEPWPIFKQGFLKVILSSASLSTHHRPLIPAKSLWAHPHSGSHYGPGQKISDSSVSHSILLLKYSVTVTCSLALGHSGAQAGPEGSLALSLIPCPCPVFQFLSLPDLLACFFSGLMWSLPRPELHAILPGVSALSLHSLPQPPLGFLVATQVLCDKKERESTVVLYLIKYTWIYLTSILIIS